jgi:hypothetical protein
MISQLVEQVYEAQSKGMKIEAAEVGPKTWLGLMDIAEKGTGKAWPPEFKRECKSGSFMGIPIRPNDEVPEGKLYPLEGVN